MFRFPKINKKIFGIIVFKWTLKTVLKIIKQDFCVLGTFNLKKNISKKIKEINHLKLRKK